MVTPANGPRPVRHHAELISGIPPWLFDFESRSVKAYLALRSFERKVGSGAFPSVATVAKMIGVSDRVAWRSIKELKDAGAIVSVARQGNNGQTTSNRYYFPANLNAQLNGYDAGVIPVTSVIGGMTPVADEGPIRDLVQEDSVTKESWTRPPTEALTQPPAAAARLVPMDSQEVPQGPMVNQTNVTNELEPAGKTRPGRRRSIFMDSLEEGQVAPRQISVLDQCKATLTDPDSEHRAAEILERLDKLRTQKLGVRPISDGARIGQMVPARLMVVVDQVNVPEVLDALQWAFSTPGSARGWPERLPKVFVLRNALPKLLEAYRADLVSDITGVVEEAEIPAPKPLTALQQRLARHKEGVNL